MIAVDTNILVYAHREDSPWFEPAFERVEALANGRSPWAIPWPCLHEFLAVVTHPRVFVPPTSLTAALDQVEAWLECPSLVLLGESDGYFEHLKAVLQRGKALGARVHDARVAALCLQNGVDELWSADRDFSRFPLLRVRNPLVG